MIAVAPYQGAAKLMVDPAWLTLWTDDFPAHSLAQSMLGNERLSDRIAKVMLKRCNGHDGVAVLPTNQSGIALKVLLGFPRDRLLHLIGLLWQAPVLAPVLPNAQIRQTYGLTSVAELDLALAYRLQTPTSVVGDLASLPAFETDGGASLMAWFDQFEAPLKDRLKLLFPKVEKAINAPTERANLVTRFLQDTSAQEALIQ